MKPKTNIELVRTYLVRHGKITGAKAFSSLGVYRLSDVILKLRNQGLSIECEMKFNKATGKYYGEYSYQKLA